MSGAILQYDPRRGGFCLQLAAFSRDRPRQVFAGLLSIYLDESGLVAAIESFWDHGGLPLNGIHQAQSYPAGEYPVEGAELRVGPVHLKQNVHNLELWFSAGNELPGAGWHRQDDGATGLAVWFAQQKAPAGWPVPGAAGRAECPLVAGLTIKFARTVASFPISSLRLSAEDFK
jgi:hypothetical protein